MQENCVAETAAAETVAGRTEFAAAAAVGCTRLHCAAEMGLVVVSMMRLTVDDFGCYTEAGHVAGLSAWMPVNGPL